MNIPLVPYETKATFLSLCRFFGSDGEGTVVRLGFTDDYLLFHDGDDKAPISGHGWCTFVNRNTLIGDCVFPRCGPPPCDFCGKTSEGVFAIGGAPVSLALCHDHRTARWCHDTQKVVF